MIENNEILKTASDFSRQKFIDMGISYSKIGSIEFYKLVEILEKELKDYAQKGGLEMIISKTPKRNAIEFNLDKNGGLQTAHIKVDGYYFKGRQAISFENNWIGFAGWADSDNVKPFTNAFDKWLDVCFGSKTENITQLQNKVKEIKNDRTNFTSRQTDVRNRNHFRNFECTQTYTQNL